MSARDAREDGGGRAAGGPAEGKPRVLCVDDDPLVLHGIGLTLRRHFQVLSASSGEEALRVLDGTPDVRAIVSDMKMPGMDGATLLGRARALRPEVPRILLTGFADSEETRRTREACALAAVLEKPCRADELVAALVEAIGRG